MATKHKPAMLAGAACATAAVVCLVAAALEPPVGRGAWLTALAGDWAVRIGDEYEIGIDPQPGGRPTVYRVISAAGAAGRSYVSFRAEVKDVLEYAVDDRHILLRTNDGYVWRARRGGEDWHVTAELPEEIKALRRSLQAPRPSRRPHFLILSGVCFLGGVVVFSLGARSRGSSGAGG